ncbi:MAG: DUF6065 family protein [Halopseudomonas aestusnigri]
MIEFFKCWPDAPDPVCPSPDLRGEIPARGKFCEPFTAANTSGALICPPIDFSLTWTGTEILADLEGVEDTVIVDKLYLPDYADYWQTIAPDWALEVIPPFLEAVPERGLLQVFTGLYVQTQPGISTWIRGPINWPQSGNCMANEGIVETDWWAGPLFFVLQMQKTDYPVSFYRHTPFVQAIPVDRSLLNLGKELKVSNVADAPDDFWESMVKISSLHNQGPPGSYRRESRIRKKECPMVKRELYTGS